MSEIEDKVPRFVEENERYIEIYKITNTANNKLYVGQTVSHVLNHGKYRRYGSQKRLDSHFSEAIKNNKDKECRYLNSAIRKYGNDKFIVELITTCDMDKGDDTEDKYIKEYNSLFPNGYNLKLGKTIYKYDEETRPIKLENGVKVVTNSIEQNKLIKFNNTDLPDDVLTNIDKYIKVTNTIKKHLLYLQINGIEISFGSKKETKEQLKANIIKFINKLIEYKKELKNTAKLLDDREYSHSSDNSTDSNNTYNLYLQEKKKKKEFNLICKICNIQKEKQDFRGLYQKCRSCELTINRERNEQNREKYKIGKTEYRIKNKETINAKRRESRKLAKATLKIEESNSVIPSSN